ncbi:hypothetical protein [Streptomyces sp. bgisy084]|uniref:hypothetical protein n=1 Tax=unclassified Streptomyces TaxID=2593676 RepID=UPI003D73A516
MDFAQKRCRTPSPEPGRSPSPTIAVSRADRREGEPGLQLGGTAGPLQRVTTARHNKITVKLREAGLRALEDLGFIELDDDPDDPLIVTAKRPGAIPERTSWSAANARPASTASPT